MNKKTGEDDPIDLELVRRLADLLTETGLTEIEVEQAGMRIKVARGLAEAPSLHAYGFRPRRRPCLRPPAARARPPAMRPAATW